MLRQPIELLLSLISDSRYGSSGITKALKSVFRDDVSLFENTAGGAKVAVVGTTTENSSTCIFTNYNGPETWSAARASFAAPPYFMPFNGY
ncbi:hypothetical protein DL98DRAFT_598335 [Cadophora sp. DSE1049]|nr:hypothetical protein DL98DRAFT_598335 [Cadophora sp. DSE1049]